MDTSVKWTPTVGPCLSLLPLFESNLNLISYQILSANSSKNVWRSDQTGEFASRHRGIKDYKD